MTSASLQLVPSSPRNEHAPDVALLASLCPSVSAATWAEVLETYGGLRGLVLTSDAGLLKDLPPHAVAALRSALRLTERFRAAADGRPRLPTPQSIYDYVRPHLDHYPHERFAVLALNSRNRLLRMEIVGEGSVDQCHVDPRRFFTLPIEVQATGIVLAHAHPAGDPEPSTQDIALTRQLCEVGRALCVRVLDHLVLGENSYVSMLSRGFLRGTL